jgi:hypothetical protein
MENKNRKLPSRLNEYKSKFETVDVNMFIKTSLQDLGIFQEVQLIFESVFSSKKTNRLWKYSTSNEMRKELRNHTSNSLERRNLLYRDYINPRERMNGIELASSIRKDDYIDITESENRLTELYRQNTSIFDEITERCISIDLSSYKAYYQTKQIVNIEINNLLQLCSSANKNYYAIIYDDIRKIAKYSSEMLAFSNECNERKNGNLFSRHYFFYEDLMNSQLSQIAQMVLLFYRTLALKLSLKLLGKQPEKKECYATLLNDSSVAFDIFPAGCIEQNPHWDFELPVSLIDDEYFYGASVLVNLLPMNQELQIHKWDVVEYDSSCLTLTTFNRCPYSITLIDARLLHNEPTNKTEHAMFYISLSIDPFDSNGTQHRKAVKFVNDMERNMGISIEYKMISDNLAITKKTVKQGNLTDSIELKNLRENLLTHLKDIEVDVIDQHIKTFVADLENGIN